MTAREATVAAIAGLLVGAGLIVSGATDPSRVLAFLDVQGAWDPSLGLVLVGALLVTLPAFAIVKKGSSPLLANEFRMPARRRITWRLICGAIMFGVGWGMVGLSPTTALAAVASGNRQVILFVLAMLAGIVLFRFVMGASSERSMYSTYYGRAIGRQGKHPNRAKHSRGEA